jgi:predicted ester cyclase
MKDANRTAGAELSRRRVVRGFVVASAIGAAPSRLGATAMPGRSKDRMSEQDNINIVTQQHALISAGRIEDAAALFSDPTRNHGRVVPRRALLAILGDIKITFPDWTFPIEKIVASGPHVMVRCRFQGTHRGVGKLPVNGGLMIGVAATGRRMDVQHIHWYVVENGLIAEHWASRDDIGMMQQLGLLPETRFDFSRLVAPPDQ